MEKITDSILVETGFEGANVTCILTSAGKVLVDLPYFPQDISSWQKTVNQAGPGDIAYVIDTDYHFDHAIANAQFCRNVIGHTLTYEEMLKPGGTLLEDFMPNIETVDPSAAEAMKRFVIVPPNITFDNTLTLHSEDKTLHIICLGGHTPATSAVYVEEWKTLISGDSVVHDTHPYMGQADIIRWEQALETIKGMEVERIVPGHGDICDIRAVEKLSGYLKELHGIVEEAVRAGKSKEEAVQGIDMVDYFPVDDEGREMAAMSISLGAERLYDQITR